MSDQSSGLRSHGRFVSKPLPQLSVPRTSKAGWPEEARIACAASTLWRHLGDKENESLSRRLLSLKLVTRLGMCPPASDYIVKFAKHAGTTPEKFWYQQNLHDMARFARNGVEHPHMYSRSDFCSALKSMRYLQYVLPEVSQLGSHLLFEGLLVDLGPDLYGELRRDQRAGLQILQ